MSSRKEEERNEKIIRGLMKLPPNRRCINCNSLGPQYVCTNFWTFVCMTCSGIHREFTHRVKSVSMSKFTSQEVEALQRGGNQRARETFLKFWDQQGQRLPVSSNADKVREFIKNVYIDQRYADGKTSDKPPRDVQKHRNPIDETRRASSYHSYSQSPPYDFQYEERRYGKQISMRKPGSDRGLYEGKVSNLLSPSRSSDQISEDGFANEVSNPRVSDYSLSIGGDPIRFDIQSPNFQRDVGFSSPSSDTSRDFFVQDVCHHPSNAVSGTTARRTINQIHCPKRGASLGSSRSFESNALSSKSVSSGSLIDVASEPEQHVRTQQDNLSTAHSLPPSSVVGQFGGLDLFDAPFALQNIASTTSASEMPRPAKTSSTPVDLFQPSAISSVPPFDLCQPAQNSAPPSLDLFSNLEKRQQQSPATLTEKAEEPIIPRNEGWATFDVPQHAEPIVGIENSNPAIPPNDRGFLGNFDAFSSLNKPLQWPAFHDSSALASSSWHDGLHNIDASVDAKSTRVRSIPSIEEFEFDARSWDAFENFTPLSLQSLQSSQLVVQNSSSVPDQYPGFEVSEDFSKDGNQNPMPDTLPHSSGILSHVVGASYLSSAHRIMAGGHAPASKQRSTNPFDLPDDSDLETSNTFLDMSSLQAVLPNGQMPTSFAGGATQPWFTQNSVSYMPTGSQGPLGFMAVQGPTTRIVHVSTQGPVASIGGNPFA